MNRPLKTGLQLTAALAFAGALTSCDSKPVPVDVIAKEYAKGLDLQAVTNLARTSKTPKELEEKLNSSTSGVNNIDLNDDKIVDYINVTEFGKGDERGFSLTAEISPGQVQEIATIVFTKAGDQVDVQTTGNSSLYGNNGNYYRSSFGLTDVLLWSYLLSNHSPYRSPYGYNNYPGSSGGGWSRSSNTEYGTKNSRYRSMSRPMASGTASMKTTVTSPNASKQAARAKIISNPKQSQRSFAQRTGKARSFGGFGRSTSSSSSRSSFGGGK